MPIKSSFRSGQTPRVCCYSADSRSKGCRFESLQERRENLLLESQLCVLTPIRCPFHPVLPQWHVKDPGYSNKNAGGRLHLNTQTPLTQRNRSELTMLSRHSVETYKENELTRNSSGNTGPQSSQLAQTGSNWSKEWN